MSSDGDTLYLHYLICECSECREVRKKRLAEQQAENQELARRLGRTEKKSA